MSIGYHTSSHYQCIEEECPACGEMMALEGTLDDLGGVCPECGEEVYRDLVDEADEWRISMAEDLRYYE